MGGVGGMCRAELSGAEFDPLAIGDSVTVKLDSGGGMLTVFTGEVSAFAAGAGAQSLTALDGVAKLAGREVSGAYEDVSLDSIIKDLISQAGATAGEVCTGPQVPFYAVHRTPTLLVQLRTLAEACGADIYSKGDGKVHVATPGQGASEHSFQFGENVLFLELARVQLPWDSVEVWGEGAASSQGADKAHWLTADLSGVSGKAALSESGSVSGGKLGSRPRLIRDGALRSGGAAEDSAKARMTWLATRRLSGRLEAYGASAVMPGDHVKLEKLPAQHAAATLLSAGGPLRVRGVRHLLDRARGLVTRLEF